MLQEGRSLTLQEKVPKRLISETKLEDFPR